MAWAISSIVAGTDVPQQKMLLNIFLVPACLKLPSRSADRPLDKFKRQERPTDHDFSRHQPQSLLAFRRDRRGGARRRAPGAIRTGREPRDAVAREPGRLH